MITVKEEFLGSVKTKLAIKMAGSDAVVLWLAIKGYVSETNSGGFVPESAIPELTGCPKRWQKALKALIECGKKKEDGTIGAGLLDVVPHGYKLHDYEDHGTPVEVEDERRRKQREQKRARRAELKRRAAERTMSADSPRTEPDMSGVPSQRQPPPACTRGRDPQPSPAQPSPKNTPHSPPEGGESEGSRLVGLVVAAGGPADELQAPPTGGSIIQSHGVLTVDVAPGYGVAGGGASDGCGVSGGFAISGEPTGTNDPRSRPRHVRNFEASFGPVHPDDAEAFARWAKRFGKTEALFDAKRASCLEDRRLEGMTLRDVDDALEGAAVDEWAAKASFKLWCIFADRERFETFVERGRAIRSGNYRPPAKPGAPPPKQPNSGYISERMTRG